MPNSTLLSYMMTAQNILAHQVQQLLHQMQTDPILQPMIAPSFMADQILCQPPSDIWEWICSSALHIQQ